VFWQTGQYLGVFSTRTEKEGFTGFSGTGWEIGKGKGAWNGLIFPYVSYPIYSEYLWLKIYEGEFIINLPEQESRRAQVRRYSNTGLPSF
jgi:hypothetical protein